MKIEEREKIVLMADALDVQIEALVPHVSMMPREFRVAIERLEEAAMWIRRCVDRT